MASWKILGAEVWGGGRGGVGRGIPASQSDVRRGCLLTCVQGSLPTVLAHPSLPGGEAGSERAPRGAWEGAWTTRSGSRRPGPSVVSRGTHAGTSQRKDAGGAPVSLGWGPGWTYIPGHCRLARTSCIVAPPRRPKGEGCSKPRHVEARMCSSLDSEVRAHLSPAPWSWHNRHPYPLYRGRRRRCLR